jgi:hypothetical protein
MDRYLTPIEEKMQCLAVSYAVPAGSREVTVTIRFISIRTVHLHSYFGILANGWQTIMSSV